MADASDVFAGIGRRPGTRYTALVPNLAGLDRALAAGVAEIAIFAAASETFSRKNINQTIDDSLGGYRQVCERAIAAGLRVRGYLSTAFGCPFEGDVPPARVADIAARLADLGVFEVAISDTIAIAHPGQVPRVLDAVLVRLVALGVCAVAGLEIADAGVAAIPIEALYLVIAVAMWGRTAGMVVVRTEIERVDGFVPPGFRVSLVRWLVPAAGLLLTLLGTVGVILNLVWLVAVYAPMLGERRQGLHDRAAGTVVVRRGDARR